ncbi:MAG: rhomboid family intramembrane serine protease [Candidatus Ancillula sp.]|jgi:membrane associated rhomboid family serine protease|nr:rhomboid family intramembrane serine protease [Candidatus Ancillula sp.]
MEDFLNKVKYQVKLSPVTCSIIGVCVVVWIAELIGSHRFISAGIYNPLLANSQPYRYITSIFMHDLNPIHILLNMYALYSCGKVVEKLLGTKKFLLVYFISGIIGNLFLTLFCYFTGDFYIFAYGASGAIFGLFGALIILYKSLGQNAGPLIINVGIIVLLGVFMSSVAWQAHVGGLIGGLATTYILARKGNIRLWW